MNHNHTHNSTHEFNSVQYQDTINAHDDLDRQIEEAAAAQNEYNEWKAQLAADCHASGVHFPQGFALQRAWNSEQKKRAEKRKAIAIVERRKQAILAQMSRLAAEMKQLDAQLAGKVVQSIQQAQEEQVIDFDALDAELMRVQEQRELAEKEAKRQQEMLFSNQSNEGTKLHPDDL